MDQENSFVEEINENDLKDEWLKKALVVLITIAVLSGTYYFTSLSDKKAKMTVIKTEPIASIQPEIKELKQLNLKDLKNLKTVLSDKPVIKPEITEVKVSRDDLILQTKQEENKPFNKIYPTNKALVVKSALLVAGKSDPFTGNAGDPQLPAGLKSFLPKYIGTIPMAPSLKGLPNIGSLPNLNVPNSNPMPGKIPFVSSLAEVKGFIGNKVIMNVNGISESLKVNESFQGIKIVKIDQATMTVKFIQDKKVITKSLN